MIPRPTLLIVTCAACLSVSARSVNAFQTQTPTILAKTQPAKKPFWTSPIVLGGVGAAAIIGAATVVILKRTGRSPEVVNPAPPPLSLNGGSNGSAPKPADFPKNGNGRSLETATQSETLTQVIDLPKPAPQPKVEETTRLARVSIVDELIQDLRSPDPAKRRKVIWELGQRGDTRAVQPLVDLLIDSDSKQRSLILSTLSEIGTRTLKPMTRALAISLQDENSEVRKNAIRDLTRVYDMVSQISNLLHKATEDSDADVQETAKWALGQLSRIRSAPNDTLPKLKNSVSPPENLP
jgi:HEAT repeats